MINIDKETIDTIAGWASLALLCAGSFAIGHLFGEDTNTVNESAMKVAEANGYLKCLTDTLETVKECSKETTN